MSHEHPVSREELMAYGDGQLQRDHARQIAAAVQLQRGNRLVGGDQAIGGIANRPDGC